MAPAESLPLRQFYSLPVSLLQLQPGLATQKQTTLSFLCHFFPKSARGEPFAACSIAATESFTFTSAVLRRMKKIDSAAFATSKTPRLCTAMHAGVKSVRITYEKKQYVRGDLNPTSAAAKNLAMVRGRKRGLRALSNVTIRIPAPPKRTGPLGHGCLRVLIVTCKKHDTYASIGPSHRRAESDARR